MINKTKRAQILNDVLRKLGARRAAEAKRTPDQGVLTNGANCVNPTGLDGVDRLPSGNYRARIRFCDALTGCDTRVTLGSKFGCAEEAGYAFCEAHILLWGSASRYTVDQFEG